MTILNPGSLILAKSVHFSGRYISGASLVCPLAINSRSSFGSLGS